MKKLYVAVQGAAKSARLAACLADGAIQTMISFGPLTPKVSIDFEASLERAFVLLAKSLDYNSVNALVQDTEIIALAMSGICGPSDTYAVLQNLRDIGFGPQSIVCEDVWATLAAEGYDEGVVVMASTGANVFIRSSTGVSLTVGGWGSDIADQGSGFHIGIMAVRRALEHMDGRQKLSNDFMAAILGALNLSSAAQLIPWYHEVRRTSYWRSKIADLAIPVVSLAESGTDPTALSLLSHSVNGLLSSFQAAINRGLSQEGILKDDGSYTVILTGGLGVASVTYQNKIRESIKNLYVPGQNVARLQLRMVLGCHHPIVGALAFAVARNKNIPDHKVFEKIQAGIQAFSSQ